MIRYTIYTLLVGVLLSFAYSWKAYQGNFLPMVPITFVFMALFAMGEFFRPPGRKNNTHVIILGVIASLIIFWGGHIRAYNIEKTETAEYVRENDSEATGTDQELFDTYIQNVTGNESASGFGGYFRYLLAVGFDEEVRFRELIHFSGGWVVLAWLQHIGMFAFGIWGVWKATHPEAENMKIFSKEKKKSKQESNKRKSFRKTVQTKKSVKNIADFVKKEVSNDGTVHFKYTYKNMADFFAKGSKTEAMALVDYGIPPETKDDKGTPLLFAMILDRLDVSAVTKMAKNVEDFNFTDQHQNTFLHMVGRSHGNSMGYYIWYDERLPGRYSESSLKKLETLAAKFIQLGAELDVLNEQEQTPLMLYAQYSSFPFFKWVMKQNPDIDVKDKLGNSALMYAIKGGDSQLQHLDLLIKAGADFRTYDNQGKNAFHNAARGGHTQLFWRLTEELGEKEKQTLLNQVMPEAVLSKDQNFIEELLEKGAQTNHQKKLGQTPLSHALFTRDKKILHSILDSGAEINPKGKNAQSALVSAVNFLWPEGVRIILEHGTEYENFPNKFTPYMALAKKADNGGYMHLWKEIIEILEPLEISINQTDDWDYTALDYLCGARNHTQMRQCEQQEYFAEYLLNMGADPYRKCSEDGKSPMERAAEKELDNVIKIMKEKSI